MSASNLPRVRFNHLYVVLDDKTYRSIIHSDYLRIAFPGVEQRATRTGTGEGWAGSYFYCRDSYLEFFSAGSKTAAPPGYSGGHWHPGAQIGWAGLAFSVDQPGGAAAIAGALRETFNYRPHHELRQLRDGPKRINWFTTVWLAERLGMGSFESWLMEYHPDIFTHKNIPLAAGANLTTQAYLSRWNADPVPGLEARGLNQDTRLPEKPASKTAAPAPVKRPSAPPEAVFSNVIGATLHLDEPRMQRYAEVLRLFGYDQRSDKDDLVLSAPDFTLRITPQAAASGYRISALRLAMARPSVAPMTFVFAGGSRLSLNRDMTAEWCFGEIPGLDINRVEN